MANDKAAIELSLSSLELLVAGTVKKPSTGNHAVKIELQWPRIGIQSRSYTKVFKLVGNECKIKADDWVGGILLKENVTGRFALKISVSPALSDAEVDELAAKIAKTLGGELADIIEDGLGGMLGKVAAVPVDYLATLAGKAEARPVATATIVLDTSEFSETGGRVLTLPLTSPGKLAKTRRTATGKRNVKQTVLKAGDPNGVAVLAMKTL